MCVSKSRQKSRPAQPRVERRREPREFAGPIRATSVRVRGCRGVPPLPPARHVLAVSDPSPHAYAVQATPRRSLPAHHVRPEGSDRVQVHGFVEVRLHDGRDAGRPTFTCEHTAENPPIRVGPSLPICWGNGGTRRPGVGSARAGRIRSDNSEYAAMLLGYGRGNPVPVYRAPVGCMESFNGKLGGGGTIWGTWSLSRLCGRDRPQWDGACRPATALDVDARRDTGRLRWRYSCLGHASSGWSETMDRNSRRNRRERCENRD